MGGGIADGLDGDFADDFAGARARFVAAARAAGAATHVHARDDLAGRDGEVLSVDVAVLGDPGAARAALVISGTHGSEGFCGSAVQHRWLRGCGAPAAGVKVVLVHAISPWAMSHRTRATETNVDLNRNFLPEGQAYGRENPAYDLLAPFLHGPAGRADDHLAARDGYLACLAAGGTRLERESLEGQSRWPEGLFHTGMAPEWSNLVFRRILREHLGGAREIGFMDIHTGMGRFGEVVHLVFDEAGSPARAAAERWWGLGSGGAEARPPMTLPRYAGLLCTAIGQEVPGAAVAGAVIEFGTGDDYAVFRGDRLDRWLRHEGREDPDRERLREDYMDLVCPSDLGWRRFVLDRGPRLIDEMVAGLAAGGAGGR